MGHKLQMNRVKTNALAILAACAVTAFAPSPASAATYWAAQNGYTLQPGGVDIFGDLHGATYMRVPPGTYIITAKTGIGVSHFPSVETSAYCTIFVNKVEVGPRSTAYLPAASATSTVTHIADAISVAPVTVTLPGSTNWIQYICYGASFRITCTR